MAIKIIMLVVFFAIMIAIGIYSSKSTKDVGGFVLGGRNIGPWLSAFAYGTSYFSAVIFVGYAGQFGWKFGVASTWVGVGNCLIGSLLAWVILGRRTRLMTHSLNSATMPDFFEKRFDSRAMRILAAVLIFVFLIPYTASLYNGLSRLFEMAFNVDYTICIIVMALITAIYVIAGGYMATVISDFVQGIIMLVGIVAVIGAVLKINGGFLSSLSALAEVSDPATSTQPGVFASFFGPDPANLLGVVILTSLGTWGLPQMVQKFYAIKSEKSVYTGTIISTIFAAIVAGGCYFLGGFGRLFSTPELVAENGYDSIVPTMLSNLGDVMMGLIIVLVLAASMSTLSSLVLTSSSSLTLDFLVPLSKKEMSEKKKVTIMRVLLAVFIVISVIIAIVQYTTNVAFIAQMMGLSWGALAGAFLAPLLYGLYWKKTTKTACMVCMVTGPLIMIINMVAKDIFPAFLQSPINCGAFTMVLGIIIVPIVSLITKKPDEKKIGEIFACYDEKVTVNASQAMSAKE